MDRCRVVHRWVFVSPAVKCLEAQCFFKKKIVCPETSWDGTRKRAISPALHIDHKQMELEA